MSEIPTWRRQEAVAVTRPGSDALLRSTADFPVPTDVSERRPDRRGDRFRGFGLREMADTVELGHHGARQYPGGLLENVSSRDRVVEAPYQVQRALPCGQGCLPSAVVLSADSATEYS